VSGSGRVRVFEDAAALAAEAARDVAEAAAARIEALGRASLGLSGGRTPVATYRALAAEPLRSRVAWERVRIFFADERAVPPGDPESNFRLARETLIDPLGVPPRNVHRMKGEYPDLDVAVEEYEAHLVEPLDVLILGVGEDGHVASLFPGSPLVGETRRRVAAVTDSPKPPARRLTLTPRALAEAGRVLVLATGAEKAEAVARALEGEGEAREVPARLVRGRDWYLDRAAAAKLLERE
jgi:6-phosphogluconolactonase